MDENTSEIYRQLRNEEENRKYFFHDSNISEEQQREWFRNYLQKDGEYMFAVWSLDEKECLGGISIYNVDREALTAEVGRILIDRNYSGNGYGAEAIQGVLQIACGKLGLKEVYACIRPENMASRRSFEKSGFVLWEDDVSNAVVKMKYLL